MDRENTEGPGWQTSPRPGIDTYTPKLSKYGSFVASGTEYFIETPHQQSIDRKVQFVNELIRMATGTDEAGLIRGLVDARNCNNKLDASGVGYHLNTILFKMAEVQQRRDAALMAACLFINTEKESRITVPSDVERMKKIEDWSKEGIQYSFFLGLLADFNATLATLFGSITPTSSERQSSPDKSS